MYAHLNTALTIADIVLFSFFVLSIVGAFVSFNRLKKLGLSAMPYLAIGVRRSVETSLGLRSWSNRVIAVANIATVVAIFYYELPLSMVAVIISYALSLLGWIALRKHPAYRVASL